MRYELCIYLHQKYTELTIIHLHLKSTMVLPELFYMTLDIKLTIENNPLTIDLSYLDLNIDSANEVPGIYLAII